MKPKELSDQAERRKTAGNGYRKSDKALDPPRNTTNSVPAQSLH